MVHTQSLWGDSGISRALIVASTILVLLALTFSGSLVRGGAAILDVDREATRAAGGLWGAFINAFQSDILGQPGILVSAIKTLFAVIVASFVSWRLPTAAGQVVLTVSGVALNATQSAAVMWCLVFTLIKLL